MAGDITKLGVVTEGRWEAERINAAYIIPETITSVGTIGKGVWRGSIIEAAYLGQHNTLIRGYTAVSTTYAILATDYTVNCTSGTFTVTALTAVGITGQVFNVKNSGSGTITLATTGGQTIDGNATITLLQYDCCTIQSTGSNWVIL